MGTGKAKVSLCACGRARCGIYFLPAHFSTLNLRILQMFLLLSFQFGSSLLYPLVSACLSPTLPPSPCGFGMAYRYSCFWFFWSLVCFSSFPLPPPPPPRQILSPY